MKINEKNYKHLIQGKSHFEEDGAQIYLIFQTMYRYFKKISGVGNGEHVYFLKSKGLSKRINSITTCNSSITPELGCFSIKIRLHLNGRCLKQDKLITYTYGKITNIYLVYEINLNYNISSYPWLENCLFGTVTLTKNFDIDEYKHSGYGIGFERKG